jgi:hypothetical protein
VTKTASYGSGCSPRSVVDGGAVGGWRGADLRGSVVIHLFASWGGAAAGENVASTLVIVGDGGVYVLLP